MLRINKQIEKRRNKMKQKFSYRISVITPIETLMNKESGHSKYFFSGHIILIAIILLAIGCKQENRKINKIKTDREELNIKGNVESIFEIYYEAVEQDKMIIKGKRVPYGGNYFGKLILFDTFGNKIEEDDYNIDGSLYNKLICRFDGKRKVLELNYSYSDSNEFTTSFIYDNRNRLIEQNSLSKDSGHLFKIIYNYDESGNKIEEQIHSPIYKSMEQKKDYKYDDESKLIRIEENWYKIDGSKGLTATHKYDTSGNKIKENYNIFVNPKEYRISTYKYDYYQNEIESQHDYNGKISRSILEYKYDSEGNWTQKIIRVDNDPTLLIERKIEYFQIKIESNNNEDRWDSLVDNSSYKYQFSGNEYSVNFDSKPKITNSSTPFSGQMLKSEIAELNLPQINTFCRAECFNHEMTNITRDYTYKFLNDYAEYNGLSYPSFEYEENSFGKVGTLRAYKTLTDKNGQKQKVTFYSKVFVGKTSVMILYVGCLSEDYPTPEITKFLSSVKRINN